MSKETAKSKVICYYRDGIDDQYKLPAVITTEEFDCNDRNLYSDRKKCCKKVRTKQDYCRNELTRDLEYTKKKYVEDSRRLDQINEDFRRAKKEKEIADKNFANAQFCKDTEGRCLASKISDEKYDLERYKKRLDALEELELERKTLEQT